jgi:hypothetical protein
LKSCSESQAELVSASSPYRISSPVATMVIFILNPFLTAEDVISKQPEITPVIRRWPQKIYFINQTNITSVIPACHDFAEQNHQLAGIQVSERCNWWIPAKKMPE